MGNIAETCFFGNFLNGIIRALQKVEGNIYSVICDILVKGQTCMGFYNVAYVIFVIMKFFSNGFICNRFCNMLIMDRLVIGGSFAEFHPFDFQEDFILVFTS